MIKQFIIDKLGVNKMNVNHTWKMLYDIVFVIKTITKKIVNTQGKNNPAKIHYRYVMQFFSDQNVGYVNLIIGYSWFFTKF